MKQAPPYAVAYDVSDDKERARIAKILEGFGFRVQKSVFECRLSRNDRRALVERLEATNISTGSIRIYRIYAGTERILIGKAPDDPDAQFIYMV